MQKFHTIKIGGEEYKLRLTVNSIEDVEKKLGKSLYMALEEIQYNMVSTLAAILWGSLQKFNDNITYEKAVDLFDQYIDDGHSMQDMMEELNVVFDVSGFFVKGQAN